MSTPLPDSYANRLGQFFPKEIAERVLDAFHLPPSVSVRINPLKPTDKFKDEQAVPWSSNGKKLSERPSFILDPLFHAGCYYVQDSSSMILEAYLKSLDIPKDSVTLDLCAAPGGKSTILLDYLGNRGFLVANEIDPRRNAILRENLLKWGRFNHAVSQHTSHFWAEQNFQFDLVVIDAPCSGEGMFRKDDFARQQWSEALVDQCAATQAEILSHVGPLLKEEGILIYSTCTLNPIENEQHIKTLMNDGFDVCCPDLSAFDSFIVPAMHEGKIIGHYLLPGISTGEGLFISALRQTQPSSINSRRKKSNLATLDNEVSSEWGIPQSVQNSWNSKEIEYAVQNGDYIAEISHLLRSIGLPIFEIKGKSRIPKHGIAMMPSNIPSLELSLENSRLYLRKEPFSLPQDSEVGWLTVGFEGHSLGWIKKLANRFNNYYPTEFRIRQ